MKITEITRGLSMKVVVDDKFKPITIWATETGRLEDGDNKDECSAILYENCVRDIKRKASEAFDIRTQKMLEGSKGQSLADKIKERKLNIK